MLKKVPTLISLCLKKNEISLTDASVLGSAIAKHKELSFVDLSYCGLGKHALRMMTFSPPSSMGVRGYMALT